MKIKENDIRKKLIGQILEIRNMSQSTIGFLRNSDLSHLDNDLIMKLNDLAYKKIKSSRLN